MPNKMINKSINEFVANNLKTIVACMCFIVGLYYQHQSNMAKISELGDELVTTNAKLEAQYARLDNLKLDKAVFEATMKQFTAMSDDIRHIRDRMEDIHVGGYYVRSKKDKSND